MEFEKKLYDFFSTCDGKIMNVFFNAFSIIDSLEENEQALAVQFLCENVFSIKSDNSNKIQKNYYSEEQIQKAEEKIKEKFKPVLNALIEYCTHNNYDAGKFYEKIWQVIKSRMFNSKRERALALFTLVDHELIPYRNVGKGISMSDDEYHRIIDSLEKSVLPDTEYILKLDYEQKTQRASLLVDKLLSLDSKEEQTVYLALIMQEIKNNLRDEIKAKLDKI